MSMSSFESETQQLRLMLATAEGGVNGGMIDQNTSADAKLIASAIREAGLRIVIELREQRD